MEEQQLRQKLNKMADNIRDQSESSEEEDEEEEAEEKTEEEEDKPSGLSIRPASRSSIIFSRLEKHQSDSEKVDTHHPFTARLHQMSARP